MILRKQGSQCTIYVTTQKTSILPEKLQSAISSHYNVSTVLKAIQSMRKRDLTCDELQNIGILDLEAEIVCGESRLIRNSFQGLLKDRMSL